MSNLKKIIKRKFIIYSGSYSYKPNKDAIDFLNEKLMPELIRLYPKIKLVITEEVLINTSLGGLQKGCNKITHNL